MAITDNPIFKAIMNKGKAASDAVSTGNKQTEGLGNELSARSQMNRAGESALETPSASSDVDRSNPNPAPWEKVGRKYGDRPGEKRIDTREMVKPLGQTPVYDNGGKVNVYDKGGKVKSKVNVNDGKHEVAILKHGERVLTPEQNKDYEAKVMDKGGKVGEHSSEEKAHFHRAMSHLHKGALHRHLGIPEGEPIPLEKKQEAANSENPHVAAMGRMAVSMHGWKHPGKK
jgi:hypothetical protein